MQNYVGNAIVHLCENSLLGNYNEICMGSFPPAYIVLVHITANSEWKV